MMVRLRSRILGVYRRGIPRCVTSHVLCKFMWHVADGVRQTYVCFFEIQCVELLFLTKRLVYLKL